MAKSIYWLSDAEWARIEPFFHTGGVAHIGLMTGGSSRGSCTCCALARAAAYGPYTTVYNRLNRWSRQGLWLAIFQALAGHSGV